MYGMTKFSFRESRGGKTKCNRLTAGVVGSGPCGEELSAIRPSSGALCSREDLFGFVSFGLGFGFQVESMDKAMEYGRKDDTDST
jgi:hypothetical protein